MLNESSFVDLKRFDSEPGSNKEKEPEQNDVYQLEILKGKRFTQREVDILSFIISGRSSKRIAIALSISPRTVDNHMRNIMMKLGCHSRENIIQLVETSGNFLGLKNHFFNLSRDEILRKNLAEVKKIRKEDAGICILFCFKKPHTHKCLAHFLSEYLLLAGVQAEVVHTTSPPPISSFKAQDNSRFIYLIDETIKEGKLLQSFLSSYSLGIIVDISGSKSIDPSSYPTLKYLTIDKSNIRLMVFELLQALTEDKGLNKMLQAFKEAPKVKELGSSLPRPDKGLLEIIESYRPAFQLRGKKLLLTGGMCIGIIFIFSINYNFLLSSQDYPQLYTHSNITPFLTHALLDRPHILFHMHKLLKEKPGLRSLALIGIGGSGKTTLARHYAHTAKYSFVWEINAETPGSLMKSLEELGETISSNEDEIKKWRGIRKIADQKAKEEKIILFLSNKLKSMKNWLLIYDNVENIKDIQKYFFLGNKDWKNGNIIISTTNNNIKNFDYITDYIFIEKLSSEEKLQLFNKIVYHQASNNLTTSEQKKLKAFLNTIPSFPLDVSTAAYYLKITNIPFEKYSEYLENSHQALANIQTHILKDASEYTKTRYSIITLSFKKILESNENFSNLLLLISLVDSQKIPKNLLDSYQSGVVTDSFIYHLKKYSLITDDSFDKPNPSFSIHRSTQQICLEYLQNELNITKENSYTHSLLKFLESYIFKAITQEDFLTMRVLINHCEAFLKHTQLYNETLTAPIAGMLGCIYYYLSNYGKAKILLEESLFSLENTQPSQPLMISFVSMYLGNVYRALRDYGKAKDMLQYSLQICQKNPDKAAGIARVLGYLGVVYRSLGEYKKAKDLFEQSLSIHEKFFPDHIGHAWVLSHLGNTYMIGGEYIKAKPLFEKSLSIYLKSSEDYVGAAWVMGYLGNTYRELKEYQKARELLEKSLKICRKHFDDQHLYVGSALRYLGILYLDCEEYEKAKQFIEKSLEIYEKNYGEDHIETAKSLYYKGKVYFHEKNLLKAEHLINRSLSIFKKYHYVESYLPLETLADICAKRADEASNRQDQQYWERKKNEFLKESFYVIRNHFPPHSSHLTRIHQKIQK